MPNLVQKYTQEDAANYIVEMMPPSLREAGKRVTYNCKANGTYTDLMKLIKTCEAARSSIFSWWHLPHRSLLYLQAQWCKTTWRTTPTALSSTL